MKLTRNRIRRLIKEELKVMVEAHDPRASAMSGAISSIEQQFGPGSIITGDRALQSMISSWKKFVSRNPTVEEELHAAWDDLADGIPWQQVKQDFIAKMGDDPRISGAISFHGRKVKPGSKLPSSAEIRQEISSEKAAREDSRRNAPPQEPRDPGPYGGGSRYRPWGRST